VIFSNVIGFLIFLILLALANYLKAFIFSHTYWAIVDFLIANLWLSFWIFFLTLIADIFWTFRVPFNLVAPILSAASSIFIVDYIYRIWNFMDVTGRTNIGLPIGAIYPIVFWVVLVVGYITILTRFKREGREEKEERKAKKKSDIEWEDVGDAFRQAFYNIGMALKEAFEPKKKKK